MVTKQILNKMILVLNFTAVFVAGDHAFAMNLGQAGRGALEAQAGCMTPECMGLTRDLGLDGLQAQMQKINLFDLESPAAAKPVDRRRHCSTPEECLKYAPVLNMTGYDDNGKEVSGGTAFLISPCYAYTVSHASHSDPTKGELKPLNLKFETVGRRMQKIVTTGEVVKSGGYRIGSPRRNDRALIRLKDCIGREVGWLESDFVPSEEMKSLSLRVVGYPGDRDLRRVTISAQGKLGELIPGAATWESCVSGVSGDSGAPLVYDRPDGALGVAAMHLGARERLAGIQQSCGSKYVNLALDVGRVAGDFENEIEKDISAHGIKNPAKRDPRLSSLGTL